MQIVQIDGEFNKSQAKALQDAIKKMDMPAKKKQRLLWRLANAMIPLVKRNIREQKNILRQKFPERARDNKGKVKMLRRLPNHLRVKEEPEKEQAKLIFVGYYKRSKKDDDLISAGAIAKIHQEGKKIPMNSSNFKSQKQEDNEDEEITPSQVKKLRKLEYKYSNKKGRKVKASAKWLKENMTKKEASRMIFFMNKMRSKKSWIVNIPAREFLGINDSDFMKILKRELRNIDYGWDTNAQNTKNRGKK